MVASAAAAAARRCGAGREQRADHGPRIGRIDSLTTHLTRKCPAISEADRINACLTLNGISQAAQRKHQAQSNGGTVDLPVAQRDWTALETLAEVSRQIDLNEKHDDRGPNATEAAVPAATPAPTTQERFELQEPFTLDNPPTSDAAKSSQQAEKTGRHARTAIRWPKKLRLTPEAADTQAPSSDPAGPDQDTLTEERLQALLGSGDTSANISMAVAATARLNPSLLDPQLRHDETPLAAPTAVMEAPAVEDNEAVTPAVPSSQPWGEITYATEGVPLQTLHTEHVQSPSRGGFRLDSPNGAKSRHARARFDATRRKEVQEVRKIGACIRCRILRKTCSKGDPCDTCRKVLSPRIWRSGCVRTKFTDQLDIYSAGVQVVLAQHRMNSLKATIQLANAGATIEATHFPEIEVSLMLELLEGDGEPVMVDAEKEDVPAKVEAYMRDILPQFVQREPSQFVRLTLETAMQMSQAPADSKDGLLRRAIELWGLVEILDREQQWTIGIQPTADGGQVRWIKEDTDQNVYTTICLQLTAAAERRATAISKSLLTGMQRVLQDSKTKVDNDMFFATLILLICVEKSTWAFKAWEQDSLRAMWPLEKAPGSFTQQGYVIADLLRMLLGIRKAMPRIGVREVDNVLVAEDQDPVIQAYFQGLNLTGTCASAFLYTSSRTPTHAVIYL